MTRHTRRIIQIMNTAVRPIRKVSVVSTGTVRIRPQHVESAGSPLLWWLLTSRKWTPPRPINVYVIEHERGLVLFDTGQDRGSVTAPDYFPGGLSGHLYARLAQFAIRPGETLSERLRGISYEPSQVRTVVLSHLHQDHIGGLAELSNAEILVSAREWAELDTRCPEVKGLLPAAHQAGWTSLDSGDLRLGGRHVYRSLLPCT